MLKKNVLVPIATGIEEIEAITIIDVLRRAGLSVRVATIEDREVTGANGIKIVADSDFIDEVLEDYDAIVLPGGSEGAKRFAAHGGLCEALETFNKNDFVVAAICASPAVVFGPLGLVDKKKATSYPSFANMLKHYQNEKVVVDGNLVTSQGPGTAMDFALKLAEILAGEKIANDVRKAMLA